jgi:hypothetical protein
MSLICILKHLRHSQFPRALRDLVLVAAFAMAANDRVGGAEPGRHPGHYAAVNELDAVQSIRHLDEPALRGVSKCYYWADLEPEKDTYDLDAIKKDPAFLKGHSKQLVVFITDKTFRAGKNPLPAYLAAYGLPNGRGVTAMRWDPAVIGRFVALNHALARAFDDDPNFEGVAFQESALGRDAEVSIVLKQA